MSDNVFVGMRASGLTQSPAFAPYSKVIAWYDDEHAFVAGDDTGRALEVDLPGATQATVDAMLESIRGFVYQPYEAADALLDPAAELGDGITVNGVYGPLASADADFDGLCTVNAAAPEDEEIDHEYPYQSPQDRAIKRKVTLGQSYYGTRITRQNGLEIVKTAADGTERSRVVLNSDLLAFYNDDGEEALYFDPVAGKYKFRGLLNVSDNFIVDENGDVTIHGNLDMETGTIKGPTISGGKFTDLSGTCYFEMSGSIEDDVFNGSMSMYMDSFSEDTPIFSVSSAHKTAALIKSIALQCAGVDFMSVSSRGLVSPRGVWNFGNASVTGLDLDGIYSYDITLEASDGDILLSCPGTMAFRMDVTKREFRFAVDGVTWILDADGLHTQEE